MLLFLITTPVYVMTLASSHTGNEMTWEDTVFARFLMALVMLEWFADQQQWGMFPIFAHDVSERQLTTPDYHNAKAYFQKTAKVPPKYKREDVERGFCTSGLWAWSRHPNFAAEQAIWVTLYQWSCYVTESIYSWPIAGALSYLALFQGSTWLTELITAGKYPEYSEYQLRVGKFIPSPGTAMTGSTTANDPSVSKERREAMRIENRKKK